MPSEIILPPLDREATTATIERYYVEVGATVAAGQPLVVVRTERFEWDVPATASGEIMALLAQPGTVVPIGAPLVQLHDTVATTSIIDEQLVRATPLARKVAALHGVELGTITGSGRGGRITQADVLAQVDGKPSTQKSAEPAFNLCFTLDLPTEATVTAPSPRRDTELGSALAVPERDKTPQLVPHTAEQRARAEQALRSKTTAPHALTAVEVDLSRVLAECERLGERMARRGITLTPTACIAYSTVGILGQHRLLNSAWSDDGPIMRGHVQLGVVQSERSLATTTIVPRAAELNLQGIARALNNAASTEQAIDDHRTSTSFRIYDTGVARWEHGVLPLGQAAALTVSAVEQRPVVVDGDHADTIMIRPMVILTLTYDARFITQPQADAFVVALKQRLEHFSAL